MKKILMVLHYPPPVHGASLVGEQIINSGYIKRCFDVDILPLSTRSDLNDGKVIGKLCKYLKLNVKLFFKLFKKKYDVFYMTPSVSGISFYKDFFLTIYVRLFINKIVYHFHNKGLQKNKWIPSIISRLFLKESCVILLSDKLKYDVERYVENECVYICPNGVDMEANIVSKSIKNVSTIKIMLLSNMIKSKGVFDLIDACKMLNNLNVDYECNLYGPCYDIEKTDLLRYIKTKKIFGKVIYHGGVYGDAKKEAYKNNHVFVFPTYNDCFPLVLLEAMSYGMPIISTSEGGISDIVCDSLNGFIVDKHSPLEITEKIKYLLENKDVYEELSKNSLEIFADRYSVKAFEQRLVRILDDI
ncbi:glycosyltransferase family 4 protein [Prosthecochloris sp. SCSIO W1103]|uniref:glycosyltransferase family 4 protein n=1 Tax=Prosthecochloris sp. SCSIO W1103 TaxID=2992244 RepID=UPI00223E2C6F|nr:glycosyltransferase family 4 protein [Prosthecochloris sp. SCSIO W1103]UZJ38146.1 glycosyltransferase family 4 protein [Prosthecochloris sp. SCSIO W1103]